jgi:hypothetical protein
MKGTRFLFSSSALANAVARSARISFLLLIVPSGLFADDLGRRRPIAAQSIALEQTPKCLAGNPKDTLLNDQIEGKVAIGDDEFLRAWRDRRKVVSSQNQAASGSVNSNDQACADENNKSANFKWLTQLGSALPKLGFTQRGIKASCVTAAITRLDNVQADKWSCVSDTSSPRRQRTVPCMTKSYVEYVTYATNEAIRCLSRPDRPVNPQVVFSKINNESAFGSFLSGNAGKGLTQMTTIAAQEMLVDGEGAEFLKSIVDQNPEGCRNFQAILKLPLQLNNENEARICQFISPGGGIGRTLLTGIGLHLYYRDGMRGSARERLEKLGLQNHPELQKMADYLALVSFSSEGPAGASEALVKIQGRIQRNTSFQAFKSLLDKQVDYLRAIDQKMREVFQSTSIDCTEDM